jgi:hypothetical protein
MRRLAMAVFTVTEQGLEVWRAMKLGRIRVGVKDVGWCR